MKRRREDGDSIPDEVLHIDSAVEKLSAFGLQELQKLLQDSKTFIFKYYLRDGTLVQIDIEKLALALPSHLLSKILSSNKSNSNLSYILCGIQVFHSLSDFGKQNARSGKVFNGAQLTAMVFEMVIHLLTTLSVPKEESILDSCPPLLYPMLVSSGFSLLAAYISPMFEVLIPILVSHPKVETFMSVAFDALQMNIIFLHYKLVEFNTDIVVDKSVVPDRERVTYHIFQQCESSLQFLLSMCQQKMYRDVLIQNKEACTASLLSLARVLLKLDIPMNFGMSFDIVAAAARMKSEVLAILILLCEMNGVSYLDEVAQSLRGMQLAKSICLEILDVVKSAFSEADQKPADLLHGCNSKGFLILNSMCLVAHFSANPNFQEFFIDNLNDFLVDIFARPNETFISTWCPAISLVVKDAGAEHLSFMASYMAKLSLNDLPGASQLGLILNQPDTASSSALPYLISQQDKTGHLIKIIVNLNISPDTYEGEEGSFLDKFFMNVFVNDPVSPSANPVKSVDQRATEICQNLSALSTYASSLIPNWLTYRKVELFRSFTDQFLSKVSSLLGEDFVKIILIPNGSKGRTSSQIADEGSSSGSNRHP